MVLPSTDWFVNHRQEYILGQLKAFGIIRRKDLADKFGLTIQSASADIGRFIDSHPDVLVYDGKAKMYVLNIEEE